MTMLKKIGDVRQLNAEEIEQVSGGWEVVGPKFWSLDNTMTGIGIGWGMMSGSPAGTGYGWSGAIGQFSYNDLWNAVKKAEDAMKNLVDTNGDGVPDSPEIVVTAPVSHSDIQFANNQAQWNGYLLGAIIGLVGSAYGYPNISNIVGLSAGAPPVNNQMVDGNSDLIRDQIQASGGINNYAKQYIMNRY